MGHQFAAIAFTPTIRDIQVAEGSRDGYAGMDEGADYNHRLGGREAVFIGARDSFYMASVSETGWPYVQHRGGPAGFLRVTGPKQLAYADFRGNLQLISVGNAGNNDKCSLILMDYPGRRRLKILGHMRVEDAATVDAQTLAAVDVQGYRARVERVVFIDVVAFDWNCPQHITRRYTEAEFTAMGLGAPLQSVS